MDLTTLTYVLLVVVGLLGLDVATHPPDVILEGQAIGTERTSVNATVIEDVLKQEVSRISATPTVMAKPAIRVGRLEGFAMSVAETMKMESIAYALQAQLGYRPDEIKISLYNEGGAPKVLVSGIGHRRMASFQQQVAADHGETVVELLKRAAAIGMAHIDPYITALNELQSHAVDKDFTHPESIIAFALSGLPPTPVSTERAKFENLNGIIALFKDDVEGAAIWFERAIKSDPGNVVALLNLSFAEMQLDYDRRAVERLQAVLRDQPPTDKILLGTAWMSLGAAQLGVQDVDGADRSVARAVEINPDSATAYDLWADIKREQNDEAGATQMHGKALEASALFENYGEIAALYFRLAWRGNQQVMRSPYNNPDVVDLKGRH